MNRCWIDVIIYHFIGEKMEDGRGEVSHPRLKKKKPSWIRIHVLWSFDHCSMICPFNYQGNKQHNKAEKKCDRRQKQPGYICCWRVSRDYEVPHNLYTLCYTLTASMSAILQTYFTDEKMKLEEGEAIFPCKQMKIKTRSCPDSKNTLWTTTFDSILRTLRSCRLISKQHNKKKSEWYSSKDYACVALRRIP